MKSFSISVKKELVSFRKFLLQVVTNLEEENNLEQEVDQSKCPRNFKVS